MAVVPEIRSEGLFYEIVMAALGRNQVAPSEHTEFYLVGLLDTYASAQRSLPVEPLALKILRSEEATRTLELKEVGDTTLVVTGFFPESLRGGSLDPSYFHSLGQLAYRELSSRLSQSVLSEVYDELSMEFIRFVQVLATARTLVHL